MKHIKTVLLAMVVSICALPYGNAIAKSTGKALMQIVRDNPGLRTHVAGQLEIIGSLSPELKREYLEKVGKMLGNNPNRVGETSSRFEFDPKFSQKAETRSQVVVGHLVAMGIIAFKEELGTETVAQELGTKSAEAVKTTELLEAQVSNIRNLITKGGFGLQGFKAHLDYLFDDQPFDDIIHVKLPPIDPSRN